MCDIKNLSLDADLRSGAHLLERVHVCLFPAGAGERFGFKGHSCEEVIAMLCSRMPAKGGQSTRLAMSSAAQTAHHLLLDPSHRGSLGQAVGELSVML